MKRIAKHVKYILKYPGIIPRAFDNYFRMIALGQKRLRGIEFSLTWSCQCKCEHCSAFMFKHDPSTERKTPMTTEQIISVVKQCLKLGAMNINYTGGESLLNRDLLRIVRASNPRSNVISVATNGILFTREMAKELARAGVRITSISLDGPTAEIHDTIRGYPGCFDKAMEAIKYSQEAGIEVFLCTILTADNVKNGDIFKVVDLAEKLGTTLTINLPCPVGAWSDKRAMIGSEEMKVHRALMKKPFIRWEGISNYLQPGCPAGVEKLYISPAGDVMPCPFIHISYGNAAKEPLTEIWDRVLHSDHFNRIHNVCLVAQDEQFIRDYYEMTKDVESYPIDYRRFSEKSGNTESTLPDDPEK